MRSQFTERDTESFYDAEDALYRSFWDREGSLHWGWFEDRTGDNFLEACANLNRIMAEKAGLSPQSRLLDLGCGNGNSAVWLSRTHGCRVTGVDLSGVRIDNAQAALPNLEPELRQRLEFHKASATDLPFADERFTHVWSQATIYHVHDKEKALREAYRVLETGGTFIFDDLTKPRPDISQQAQIHVYDRLLFDTDYSFDSYQQALQGIGFQVREAHDLSQHLKSSYSCLSRMARSRSESPDDKFQALATAYGHMVEAIVNGELGWAMYLCCRK